MSTLTLQQALNQLSSQSGQYNSVQALYDLAKQVNINATGSVTILYSGQSTSYGANGKPIVSTEAVLNAMKLNGESIRIIDDTDAAKFLGSQQFKEALAGQYGLDPRDLRSQPTDLSLTKQAALQSMNDALYHPTTGPPRIDSRKYFEAMGLQGKTPLVESASYKNLAGYMPNRLIQHKAGMHTRHDNAHPACAKTKIEPPPRELRSTRSISSKQFSIHSTFQTFRRQTCHL